MHEASTNFLVESRSLGEVVRQTPIDTSVLDPGPVKVVVEVLVVVGPGPRDAADVAHEGLVDGPQPLVGQLPAPVAEVSEAHPVTTEVGARLHAADAADGVLEVRVNLSYKLRI